MDIKTSSQNLLHVNFSIGTNLLNSSIFQKHFTQNFMAINLDWMTMFSLFKFHLELESVVDGDSWKSACKRAQNTLSFVNLNCESNKYAGMFHK